MAVTDHLTGYSVQEEAIPYSPAQTSTGAAQITATKVYRPDVTKQLRKGFQIEDIDRGRVHGMVKTIAVQDSTATLTVDSDLMGFNKWATIPSFSGTLNNWLNIAMAAADYTMPVAIDDDVKDVRVNVPGFRGNVWDRIRQLASVYRIDISQVSNQLRVRRMRSMKAHRNWESSVGINLDVSNPAEQVKVYWYPTKFGYHQPLFVEGLDDLESSVITVESGAVVTQTFTVRGSLTSINQPSPVDWEFRGWGRDADTVGSYTITGKDGLPLPAKMWRDRGGSVSVRILDDPSQIELTVVGCDADWLSPFTLSVSSGEGKMYNTLHLTGSGFTWREKKEVTMHTGAPHSATAEVNTQELDSTLITSESLAYDTALRMSAAAVSGVPTLNCTARMINKPESRAGKSVVTLGRMTEILGEQTITQLNFNAWGQTFRQIGDYLTSRSSLDLEAQSFGQSVGARMRRPEGWYRVVSSTTGPDTIQYTLEADTTIGDLGDYHKRKGVRTFDDISGFWRGLTLGDVSIRPLGYPEEEGV